MSRSDFARIEEIFHEALDVPLERRESWLDAICGEDAMLRSEVLALLAAQDDCATPLDAPAFCDSGARDDIAAGRSLGDYRILVRLGGGASGVVYEAVHVPSGEHVALKVVRGGVLAGESQRRQISREARHLARLDHPGIAKIRDSGETDDGLRWFAMEKVDGETIDRWNARTHPSIDDKLALFISMCEAVHHAHSCGVVHRDLKPTNVMVVHGPTPQAKVLDFGLAHLETPDASLSSSFSESGRILGTVPYMSPEQASGKRSRVGPRSDVYSLGVLLFELLTGRLPHDTQGLGLPEALRLICERPARRLSSIDPSLGRDLDTVVRTALEKDPKRRYPSVREFGEDCERVGRSEAIQARPPSALSTVLDIVERHRLLAAFMGTIFIVTLCSAVALAILLLRARDAEDRQRASAEASRHLSDFLSEMLGSVHPMVANGEDVLVRDVLDRASNDIESKASIDPAIESSIRAVIGQTYLGLGLYEKARHHLDRALSDENVPHRVDLSCQLALALIQVGRFPDARRVVEDAMTLEAAISDRFQRVRCLQVCGIIQKLQGDYELSRSSFEEAIGILRDPEASPLVLAKVLEDYAAMLDHIGDYQAGGSCYDEAYEIRRQQAVENPLDRAQLENNMASHAWRLGKFTEAESLFASALETCRRVLGADHPTCLAIENNIAQLSIEAQRDYQVMKPVLESLLTRCRRVLGNDNPDVAMTAMRLAHVMRKLENHTEAKVLYEDALRIRLLHFGEHHSETANVLRTLGDLAGSGGDFAESEAYYLQAIAIDREILGPNHVKVGRDLRNLGHMLFVSGRHDEGITTLLEGIAILREALPDDHFETVSALVMCGNHLIERDRRDEARDILEEALDRASIVSEDMVRDLLVKIDELLAKIDE